MLLSVLGFWSGLWMLMTPLAAEANTQVIFNREGNQATVMLMGMPGDSDPFGFWEALKVPAEDFQGKLSKRFAVPAGPSGVRPFDAACVFSKVFGNNGTCTLILRNADGIGQVDRGAGRARDAHGRARGAGGGGVRAARDHWFYLPLARRAHADLVRARGGRGELARD